MAPLLQIDNLRTDIRLKHSTVHAVDDISLHVEPGETLGIVGESGCGKTMTALSIMNLLPTGGSIVGGSIRLNDRDISKLSDEDLRHIRGNEIGMIFQDPLTSLNPTMTVGKQIAEAVLLHRDVNREQAMDRAAEVLDLVGMPRARERINEYPHQFSGGMRQRVMIAMALACEPKLLIADEPTTALDVTIQKQILELIDDLRQRLGMSVILVTHDLGRHRRPRRPGRGHVRGQDRRDDQHLHAVRQPAPPLHRGAVPRAAGEGGRDARAAAVHPRPAAGPDQPAARLPVRAALPVRHRPVPGRGARAARRAARAPVRLLLPGRLGRARRAAGGHRHWRPSRSRMVAPPPAETLLQARNLVKDFAVTKGAVMQRRVGSVSAVADVSFEIGRGQTLGLVGESGCGKTTVGRLLVGLESLTSGEIIFEGQDLSKSSGRQYRRERRKIQLMFQDSYSSLDPRMRAGTILREPLVVQGIGNRAEQRKKVEEMLGHVGLPLSALDRYPHEFSGGQRQRLGFARALILSPDLIVADEPVSALDVSIQAQVLNLMRDLQRELGLTYMFISHDLSVVRYLSTRIGVMYLGKLVEIGPADEVYLTPAHPYTRGLIDSAPVADPVAEQAKEERGVRGELPSAIHPPSGCRFRTRCPLAQEICAEVEPPMNSFSTNGHAAACHFPLQPVLTEQASTTATAP